MFSTSSFFNTIYHFWWGVNLKVVIGGLKGGLSNAFLGTFWPIAVATVSFNTVRGDLNSSWIGFNTSGEDFSRFEDLF
ncbi:hypothetical protein J7E37_13415 [Bacillus sp. ISL-39]|nr:hypothetical protein [Bacillus sp. ISL-39]